MAKRYRSSTWAEHVADGERYAVAARVCRLCHVDAPLYYFAAGLCLDCAPVGRGEPHRRQLPMVPDRAQSSGRAALPQLTAGELANLPIAQARAYTAVRAGFSLRTIARTYNVSPASIAQALKRLLDHSAVAPVSAGVAAGEFAKSAD